MFKRFCILAIGTITLAGCGNLNQAPVTPTANKPSGYLVTLNVTDGSTQASLEQRYGGKTLVFDANSGFAMLHTSKAPAAGDPAVKTVEQDSETLAPEPKPVGEVQLDGSSSWGGGSTSWSNGISSWGTGMASWGSGTTSWGSGSTAWGSGSTSWGSGTVVPALPTENQATWNQIKLYEAHRLSRNFGGGIKIAVIDSGIDLNHPVFAGKLPRTEEWWDYVGNDATPQDEPGGTGYGHGTAVAGIILQVAPRATIMPIRVLRPDGSANTSDVVAAIGRAVNYGANIINLSLGTSGYDQSLMDICTWANNNGVRIVAAAGNNGQKDNLDSPGQFSFLSTATYQKTIGVGSVNANDQRSSFSSYGDKMWAYAPGENIWSAYPGNQSARFTGTSFAAPIVTGALALGLSDTAPAQRANLSNALKFAVLDWPSATYFMGADGVKRGGRFNFESFMRNLPGWTEPTDLQAGIYQISNVNSGKCLDVTDVSTANGAIIQQWGCSGADQQKWRIEPVGAGLYKLKAMHSGKVMDVSSVSLVDRAKIHQWGDLGSANQKWQIQAYGSGYRLIASHSGKCLDLFNFAVTDGFQLEQNICNNGTAQQFKLKALF